MQQSHSLLQLLHRLPSGLLQPSLLPYLRLSRSKAGGAHPARPTARIVVGGLVAMAFTMAVGHFVGIAVA